VPPQCLLLTSCCCPPIYFVCLSVSVSCPHSRKKHIILIRKTLTPTSEQLSLLPLRPGANTITFRAGGAADLTAYVYLLRWNTRLVSRAVPGVEGSRVACVYDCPAHALMHRQAG
jgi:hypothetical protein